MDHKKVATHLGWSSWPRRILAKAASSYNCANSPKFTRFPRPPRQKPRPPRTFFRKGHLGVDPVGPQKSCDPSGMVQLASADFSKSGLELQLCKFTQIPPFSTASTAETEAAKKVLSQRSPRCGPCWTTKKLRRIWDGPVGLGGF